MINVFGVVSRTRTNNEMQQQAQIFLTRLGSLVQQCDSGGITALQNERLVALGMHTMHDVDPRGRKIYAPELLLLSWRPGSREIRETASDPMPADNRWQPIKLGPDAIESMALTIPHRRIWLRQVETFEASVTPLRVAIVMRGEVNQVLRVERNLALRNVF